MAKEKKGKSSKRPPLTESEREAARKLKERWLAIPKATRPTQEEMCEMWGQDGKITQSGISQYLNGAVPLNVTAAIRFASIFKCKPEEILDVPELRGRVAPDLPSNVVHIQKALPFPIELFDNLPDIIKGEIIGTIKEKARQLEIQAKTGRKK